MKFRKKPVVIEAIQWTGFNKQIVIPEVKEFDPYGENIGRLCAMCQKPLIQHGTIQTLEGQYIVCPNDWIIEGVKGKFYPCKPDIFQQTYEEVKDG